MTESVLEKAKAYARRLIKFRPRSQQELKGRLKARGFSEEIIGRVVSDFEASGLIDDRQFARLWVKMRSQTSPRGLSCIRMDLEAKGVARDVIDGAVEELRKDYDEEEVARGLLKRRRRQLEGLDRQKARARFFGYLKRRGFSNEVVYKLINEI